MFEPFVHLIKTQLDNPIKEMETDLKYSTFGRNVKYIQILVGKPQKKRQLERPRYKWQGILTSKWRCSDCGLDLSGLGNERRMGLS